MNGPHAVKADTKTIPGQAAETTRPGQPINEEDNIMEKDRFQFFEKTKTKYLLKWERQIILDCKTMTVYMPAINIKVLIAAIVADKLIQMDGHNYCPVSVFVELYPEWDADLLAFEKEIQGRHDGHNHRSGSGTDPAAGGAD